MRAVVSQNLFHCWRVKTQHTVGQGHWSTACVPRSENLGLKDLCIFSFLDSAKFFSKVVVPVRLAQGHAGQRARCRSNWLSLAGWVSADHFRSGFQLSLCFWPLEFVLPPYERTLQFKACLF